MIMVFLCYANLERFREAVRFFRMAWLPRSCVLLATVFLVSQLGTLCHSAGPGFGINRGFEHLLASEGGVISPEAALHRSRHDLPLLLVRPFIFSPQHASRFPAAEHWYARLDDLIATSSDLVTSLGFPALDQNSSAFFSQRGILLFSVEGCISWHIKLGIDPSRNQLRISHTRLLVASPSPSSSPQQLDISWLPSGRLSVQVRDLPNSQAAHWLPSSAFETDKYTFRHQTLTLTFDRYHASIDITNPLLYRSCSPRGYLGCGLASSLCSSSLHDFVENIPALFQFASAPCPSTSWKPLSNTSETTLDRDSDDLGDGPTSTGARSGDEDERTFCEKGSSMLFVTGCSQKWFLALKNLVGSVHRWQPSTQRFIVYDLGLRPDQLQELSTWQGVELRSFSDDILNDSNTLQQLRSITGLSVDPLLLGDLSTYVFKPVIMQHLLDNLPHASDPFSCILWLDAGLELRQPFPVPPSFTREGFFLHSEFPIEHTSASLKSYLPWSGSLQYFPTTILRQHHLTNLTALASRRVMTASANTFGLSLESSAYRLLFLPWLSCMLNRTCAFPIPNLNRGNYLQDQTILNVILYRPHGFFDTFISRARRSANAGIYVSRFPSTDLHNFIHTTLEYSGWTSPNQHQHEFFLPPPLSVSTPESCQLKSGFRDFWGGEKPVILFTRRLHPFKPFLPFIRLVHRPKATNASLAFSSSLLPRSTEFRNAPGHWLSAQPPLYNLTICAVFRDEAPYLPEWIEYHRLIGVDHFWLYTLHHDDDWISILASYIEEGVVSVDLQYSKFPRYTQPLTYEHCFADHFLSSRWIAFLDIDEFLVMSPTQAHPNFVELLLSLEEKSLKQSSMVPVLALNWKTFGTGGHKEKPSSLQVATYFNHIPWDDHQMASEGLMDFFTRLEQGKTEIKSIINTQHIDPHLVSFWTPDATYSHSPLGPLCDHLSPIESFHSPYFYPFPEIDLQTKAKLFPSRIARDPHLRPINDGWFSVPSGPSYDIAWINHYWTRSEKEWQAQIRNLDFVRWWLPTGLGDASHDNLGQLPAPRRHQNLWAIERSRPDLPVRFDKLCTGIDTTLARFEGRVERAISQRQAANGVSEPFSRLVDADQILSLSRRRHTDALLNVVEHHYGPVERHGMALLCQTLEQKAAQKGQHLHVLMLGVVPHSSMLVRCAYPGFVVHAVASGDSPWFVQTVLPNTELAAFDAIHTFDWSRDEVPTTTSLRLPPSITDYPFWDMIIAHPIPFGWEDPDRYLVPFLSKALSQLILPTSRHSTVPFLIHAPSTVFLPTVRLLQARCARHDLVTECQDATGNVLQCQVYRLNKPNVATKEGSHNHTHHLDCQNGSQTHPRTHDLNLGFTGAPLEQEKPYLGVCSCFKEDQQLMSEWIEYHRLLGVDIFYLYADDPADPTISVLQPYIEEGLVMLMLQDKQGLALPLDVQARSMASCVATFRHDVQWLALINLDEFLAVTDHRSLQYELDLHQQSIAFQMSEVVMSPHSTPLTWFQSNTSPRQTPPRGQDHQHLLIEDHIQAIAGLRSPSLKVILHTGHTDFPDAFRSLEMTSHHNLHNPFHAAPWLDGLALDHANFCSVGHELLVSPCPVNAIRSPLNIHYLHFDTIDCARCVQKKSISTRTESVETPTSARLRLLNWGEMQSSPQHCHARNTSFAEMHTFALRRASHVREALKLRELNRELGVAPQVRRTALVSKQLTEAFHAQFGGQLSGQILVLGTNIYTEVVLAGIPINNVSVVYLHGQDARTHLSSHRRALQGRVSVARQSFVDPTTSCHVLSDQVLRAAYDHVIFNAPLTQSSFCSLPISNSAHVCHFPKPAQASGHNESGFLHCDRIDPTLRTPPRALMLSGAASPSSYHALTILITLDRLPGSRSSGHDLVTLDIIRSLKRLGHRVMILFSSHRMAAEEAQEWRAEFGDVELFSASPEANSLWDPLVDHKARVHMVRTLGVPVQSYFTLLALAGGKAAESRLTSRLFSDLFQVDVILASFTPWFPRPGVTERVVYHHKVLNFFPVAQLIVLTQDIHTARLNWTIAQQHDIPPAIKMHPREAGLLRHADCIWTITPGDTQVLQQQFPDHPFHLLPIAPTFLQANPLHFDPSATAAAFFIGDDSPSNIATVDWMLAEMLPRMIASRFRRDRNSKEATPISETGFRLDMVGGIGTHYQLSHLPKPVIFHNYVADPTGLMQSSQACLNPVFLADASGFSTKVLFCLRHGLPVVTTSDGLHGMPDRIRQTPEQCGISIVRDSPPGSLAQSFADVVLLLFDNRTFFSQQSENAIGCIKSLQLSSSGQFLHAIEDSLSSLNFSPTKGIALSSSSLSSSSLASYSLIPPSTCQVDRLFNFDPLQTPIQDQLSLIGLSTDIDPELFPALFVSVHIDGLPVQLLALQEMVHIPCSRPTRVLVISLADLFAKSILQMLLPDHKLEVRLEIRGYDHAILADCSTQLQHPDHLVSPQSAFPNILPLLEQIHDSLSVGTNSSLQGELPAYLRQLFVTPDLSFVPKVFGFQYWGQDTFRVSQSINVQDPLQVLTIHSPSLPREKFKSRSPVGEYVIARSISSPSHPGSHDLLLLNPTISNHHDPNNDLLFTLNVDRIIKSTDAASTLPAYLYQHQSQRDHLFLRRSKVSEDLLISIALHSPVFRYENNQLMAFNHSFVLLVRSLPRELEGVRLFLPTFGDADTYDCWNVPLSPPSISSSAQDTNTATIPLTLSYLNNYDPSTAKLIWAARNFGVQLFLAPTGQQEDVVMPLTLDTSTPPDMTSFPAHIHLDSMIAQRFPWKSLRLSKLQELERNIQS